MVEVVLSMMVALSRMRLVPGKEQFYKLLYACTKASSRKKMSAFDIKPGLPMRLSNVCTSKETSGVPFEQFLATVDESSL